MTLDRSKEQTVMMASTEGGVEIEEVAANHPEKIIKVAIDPACGFQGFHGRELFLVWGCVNEQIPEFINLPKLFMSATQKKRQIL